MNKVCVYKNNTFYLKNKTPYDFAVDSSLLSNSAGNSILDFMIWTFVKKAKLITNCLLSTLKLFVLIWKTRNKDITKLKIACFKFNKTYWLYINA